MKNAKNSMVIGIDVDGIIADTDAVMRGYIKKFFDLDVAREQIVSFNYEECLPLSGKDMERLWDVFRDNGVWGDLPVIEGAVDVIKELDRIAHIIIISSRPLSVEDTTKEWLIRHGIPFKELIVTGGRSKMEVIKETSLPVDYFIEDRFDYAYDLAQAGIQVLLMDYPWNQAGCPHDNIHRIFNWSQIRDILIKGEPGKA